MASSVQFSHSVWLFVTPWAAAHQASLSITNSWSLLKIMSVESVMLSNHLILCCALLLPPSIFPSIRVFSNELALRIRWPKYSSFHFNISPSNEHPGLISFRMDWGYWYFSQQSWFQLKNGQNRDFPSGPVVKNPRCNAENTGLISDPGKSHTPWGN